ncbi:MAG: preprotein translocase subunit SecY, partial [Minisyncoccia bacterium]
MNTFFAKLKSIFTDKNLRKRVLFMVLFLVVFRMLASIPIPGVDQARLAGVLAGNQLFSILNVFSGGGLSTFSIIMLGVGPYITASIIMQLLAIMVPRLKEMYQEEGDRGRIRFAQYSRMLAVPLAVLQGFTLVTLLARQGVISIDSPFAYVVNLLVITGGSILLMWIGELLTEFGIGNG